VKLGVLLPTFRDNATDALETARLASEGGLDGVFAYDHLWPMGSPERPALAPFPVLTRVVTEFSHLSVGPLVSRVGLFGTSTLLEQYQTLLALAPGRVIAAIGTGDKLSANENLAYGLTYQSAERRRTLLNDTLRALAPLTETWCGGGAEATNELARAIGVTINLWGVEPKRLRKVGKTGPVSWAGPLGEKPRLMLDALAKAGATWVVAAPPFDIPSITEWRNAH
jgi:Luciferase-like monooxygenase